VLRVVLKCPQKERFSSLADFKNSRVLTTRAPLSKTNAAPRTT
jgi:hypothetical protein